MCTLMQTGTQSYVSLLQLRLRPDICRITSDHTSHHMETTACFTTNESVKAIFMRKSSEWTERTVEGFDYH